MIIFFRGPNLIVPFLGLQAIGIVFLGRAEYFCVRVDWTDYGSDDMPWTMAEALELAQLVTLIIAGGWASWRVNKERTHRPHLEHQ
jgi:hypothetical protein